MKKIFNVAPPVNVATNRTALSIEFNIVQVEGAPLTQAQDTTLNMWYPDRTLTPLILEPLVNVVDADTGTSYVKDDCVFSWYVNGTLVTATDGQGIPQNEDYYLETVTISGGIRNTGRLVVKKNVNYYESVTITCTTSFTDDASTAYNEEASVLLTSENRPEDYYDVNMLVQSPIPYNPLKEGDNVTSTFDIPTQVTFGSTILTGNQLDHIRYFWYINGVLIDDSQVENTPGYVSGQGTDTLTVDADWSVVMIVRVVLGLQEEGQQNPKILKCFDERTLYWNIPKITASPYCTAGSTVAVDDTHKSFEAIVQVKGIDLSTAKRSDLVRLEWTSKNTDASAETLRGWGDKMRMAKDDLYFGNIKNVQVTPNIYICGPKEYVNVKVSENPDVYEQVTVTVSGNTENVYSRT